MDANKPDKPKSFMQGEVTKRDVMIVLIILGAVVCAIVEQRQTSRDYLACIKHSSRVWCAAHSH